MSTSDGVLIHPGNGYEVEVFTGFSWPCLFFGFFWYGYKGMWGMAILAMLVSASTFGIAWWVFPFFANAHYQTFLRKDGYLLPQRRPKGAPTAAKVSPSRVRHLEELRYRTPEQDREMEALSAQKEDMVSPERAAPPSGVSSPQGSVADELDKLVRLRDAGVLSEQEFREQKRRLLG